MANRQYIGARYVPKFFNNNGSNEWVSGIAYEPLTIVTYLNNSYTSVKPVPSNVGSPNLATEYWACTGNVTGVVSDLTERISQCENDIGVLDGDITAVENRATALETYNQYLPTKVLCIGDSYGMKITDNWCKYLKQWMVLDDNHFTNKCSGNAGFCGNASAKNFAEQLAEPANKDTYTHIIIVGGFNDAYNANGESATQAEILTAAESCNGYIKNNYPNVRMVLLGNPAFITNDTTNSEYYELASQIRSKISECKEFYAQVASILGWKYVKELEYAMHSRQAFNQDDVVYNCVFHPNAIGAQLIAQCIHTAIKGGTYSIQIKHDDAIRAETGYTFADNSSYIYSEQYNENLIFKAFIFGNMSISNTNHTANYQNTFVKIANFVAREFYTDYVGNFASCACSGVTNGGDALYGMCEFKLKDDGLYLRTRLGNYTGYLTAVNFGVPVFHSNVARN